MLTRATRLFAGLRQRVATSPFLPDIEADARRVIDAVRAQTMTSPERIYALIQAVKYVIRANIAGDIVECGVWRGGSMMAVALTLLELRDTGRDLHLFDTFSGMSAPTALDVDRHGRRASQLLKTKRSDVIAAAPRQIVEANMAATGYPNARVHMVEGKVEETIPTHAPKSIALLRLDTDWYESTRHELIHLYPRVVPGGVVIVDDYGHWKGAKKAVDEYLADSGIAVLLHRVDYTGRMFVKC
jgi:hypothetical protein